MLKLTMDYVNLWSLHKYSCDHSDKLSDMPLGFNLSTPRVSCFQVL